jgi:hypothetical protein
MSLMGKRGLVALVVGALLAVFALASTAGATSAGPIVTTVVSGLDNPRDLAIGGGKLYVAEAGHGGADCIPGGGQGDTCIGFTSQISRIDVAKKTSTPVATGFVSIAGGDGFGATGVDGISVVGDHIFGIITESADAANGAPLSATLVAKAKAQLGRLIDAKQDGTWTTTADVGGADFTWTAQHKDLVPGQFPDANPYGVLAISATEQWVVDAGANTLDHVRNGKVDVVQFFPNPPATDAVPTCIDRGPDGALYIGELTGGGNPPGSSIVWRYDPSTRSLTQWATGLTAVTGCGFGPNGQFYAVELSTLGLDNAAPETGALVRVPPGSTSPELVLGKLSFPGGFAATERSVFLSNWSIAPFFTGLGSVMQVRLF